MLAKQSLYYDLSETEIIFTSLGRWQVALAASCRAPQGTNSTHLRNRARTLPGKINLEKMYDASVAHV